MKRDSPLLRSDKYGGLCYSIKEAICWEAHSYKKAPRGKNAQQTLQEFLKTHTVQLVGYEEDGTPIVEVVERRSSD